MRVPQSVVLALGAAALVGVACTAADDTAGADRPDRSAAQPITQSTARPDRLTGAPVPRTVSESAAFDASRLDAHALAFPPLTDVGVVPANEASWLQPDTLVLGAFQGAEARAYPLFVMQLQHVANDVLGGEPYLVTF